MSPVREALVVAVDQYADEGLGRLRAPADDAEALGAVLGDPRIGDFAVRVLRNESAQTIRVAVEDFFADRRPDDLLLLHFSCHGLKNAAGELYLAASDSRPDRLASTAVAADFVNRQMADSRAQRIALFLDCCYGGAFPRGMVVRAAGDVAVGDAFATQRDAGGRGRVVVTASSSVEYAFEGAELASDAQVGSLGVHRVGGRGAGERRGRPRRGRLGRAERAVRLRGRAGPAGDAAPDAAPVGLRLRGRPPAGPQPTAAGDGRRASRGGGGGDRQLVARRPGSVSRWSCATGCSGRTWARRWRRGTPSPGWSSDDSRRVSATAEEAVHEADLRVTPDVVDLGVLPPGTRQVVDLRLSGPPLALVASAVAAEEWLSGEVDDDGLLHVAVAPPAAGSYQGTLVVSSPTGEHPVPVRLEVVPGAPEPSAPAVVPPPRAAAEPEQAAGRSGGPAAAPVVTDGCNADIAPRLAVGAGRPAGGLCRAGLRLRHHRPALVPAELGEPGDLLAGRLRRVDHRPRGGRRRRADPAEAGRDRDRGRRRDRTVLSRVGLLRAGQRLDEQRPGLPRRLAGLPVPRPCSRGADGRRPGPAPDARGPGRLAAPGLAPVCVARGRHRPRHRRGRP